MKTLEERSEYGLKVFGEMLGADKAAQLREASESCGFASDIARFAVTHVFADIWGGTDIERRDRSFITLGILIATRQTLELKNHVRIAFRNGLTIRDLEGVLTQSLPYVGFPAVTSAMSAMIEVFRELEIDTTAKTSEERGLL